MKKQTLILAAGLTLASLLLSGCGNESKFNTAQDNFFKYYDEMKNVTKDITINSNMSCNKIHSIYKRKYDAMIKANNELKTINEIAKNDQDCKKRLHEDWRKIKNFEADKDHFLRFGKFHKKTHKCNLEGLNLDIE